MSHAFSNHPPVTRSSGPCEQIWESANCILSNPSAASTVQRTVLRASETDQSSLQNLVDFITAVKNMDHQ